MKKKMERIIDFLHSFYIIQISYILLMMVDLFISRGKMKNLQE